MTDAQFATALFAAPFLLLAAIWIVGLTVVALLESAEARPAKPGDDE
jgi:hypothetical protein